MDTLTFVATLRSARRHAHSKPFRGNMRLCFRLSGPSWFHTTIPKPVSAIITRQNGVMPPPSSSRSPSGGDTGAAGADGDGGVMGGGWPVPSAYALSTEKFALL